MDLPTVSVVIPAYNYEQYVGEAIESVLDQGYPGSLLEVVVVDDGSEDGTASVVQRYVDRHPGLVRLIRQDNRGPEATVGRGMSEAHGELLALLDADDIWMPGKLLDQVAVLQDRPEVGLVFSDLLPVGRDGRPLSRPTILSEMPNLTRRQGAQILWSNLAFASSIVARRTVVSPPPPEIPIADWWLALTAALDAEVAWVNRPLVRYRIHEANRSSGRQGAAGGTERPGPHMRDVRFKLGAMRLLDLQRFAPAELTKIWEGVENSAAAIVRSSGTYFADLTSLIEVDEDRSAALLERAEAARGKEEHCEAASLMLSALAWNPYLPEGRIRLHETVEVADSASSAPDPLSGARRFVVLADAEELLSSDDLLLAYAEAMGGDHNLTLAIDACKMSMTEAEVELIALAARCGVHTRTDIDLLAVTGTLDAVAHHWLHSRLTGYYRRPLRTPDAVSASAEYTPESLPQLRRLVETAGVAV